MDRTAVVLHKRGRFTSVIGWAMFAAVRGSWALFLGMAFLMLGNGLQATLLGVRATFDGFAPATIGLIMSGYYIGFLAGSTLAPRIVQRVGHVRVFAALASLASAAALVYAVFVDPFTWMAMRIVTGFCLAGLYVVAESWLNDRATNETRGQLLSIYMVVQLGAFSGGQLLLNVADPGGFELFILVSVVVSLALVPTSLTAVPTPSFDTPSHVSLKQLYGISPLGVVGSLGTGMAHGALIGMGAVYGASAGLSVAEISILIALTFLGGMVLQWPIGRLSDRFDRRRVLTAITFLAALSALGAIAAAEVDVWALFALIALFGGLSLPMYSLCLAHTNDFLEPKQMVAASGTLVLVVGIGAIMGPIAAAGLMSAVGPSGWFWCLGAVHAAIGGFAVYRMKARPAVPLDEQGECIAVPPQASPLAAALSPVSMPDVMDGDLARTVRR